jgi:histidinol dehydrogenase
MLELIDGRDQAGPVYIARPGIDGRAGDWDAEAARIVRDTRLRGDEALLQHLERHTGARLAAGQLRVDPQEIVRAPRVVRPELVNALEVMAEQLRATCEREVPAPWLEHRGDQIVGQLVRPLGRVAIHVPRAATSGGGGAAASQVVAGAVPATVAGVQGVAVCSPPDAGGGVAESVLAACSVVGVTEVYRMGGPEGIGALAYGTATVRPVDKIAGPGDALVMAAMRIVAGWVGTDACSWPPEIVIVAGGDPDPRELAADLVAHAERGPRGTHVLVTWLPALAEEVGAALDVAVAGHVRAEDVENALIEGGRAVLVRDLDHALDTVNAFAPQHLDLAFEGALEATDRVRTAGLVSLGTSSGPAAACVAGVNGLVPTGGASRWASAPTVRDFMTTVPVCGLGPGALDRLGPHARALAVAEGLPGTARSIDLRLRVEGDRDT